MSDKAGVMHIVLRTMCKIQDVGDEGVQIRILEKPTFKSDFVIVSGEGDQNKLTDEQIDRLTKTLEFAVAQLFAKSVKMPDDVEQVNKIDDVMKVSVVN